jgi:hypothetical protein
MMNLFSHPSVLNFDGSCTDDDTVVVDGDGSQEDDDDDSSSSDDSSEEESSQDDNATARKVCRLWRIRRKQEKEKVKRLRQEAHLYSDRDLQVASKELALTIQRSYEKKYDEADESQRYERYGSRARFMKEHMKKHMKK